MKKTKISIIIIAGNEEDVIKKALKSSRWADEIIIVAANSTDGTVDIAKKYTKKIFKTTDEYNKHFAKWRNIGLSKAKGDWVFYLDSDEEITEELQKEIKNLMGREDVSETHFAIPRQNYYLGKRVRYGGTWPDYVIRLFLRESLTKWKGNLHEEPVVKGSLGHLKYCLNHNTHRDLTSMLAKTSRWTELEAAALYKSGHPPVVWWRFPRMMLTKFFERIIIQQSWRDGTVGWVNSLFEVFNTFLIYARLWELQQKNNKG